MSDDLNPVIAEKSLLHAVWWQPEWLDTLHVTEGDFYDPRLGQIWNALIEIRKEGRKPDPVSIGNRNPRLVELLPDIVTAEGAIPANAEHYAGAVCDRATRRKTMAVIAGLNQQLANVLLPIDQVMANVERALVGGGDMEATAARLETLDEFLDRPRPPRRWVVPELLTVGDRVVFTGAEGYGKSVCLRQIAVMVACGLHPFTLRAIPRQRVLLVDCENPEEIMADVLGDLRDVARRRGQNPQDHMTLARYPQGLNLGDPIDRLELHRLCMLANPDLLVIGPAYKLYVGNANSREEDLARTVTSVLDGLREEFRFALMLEHHSPHASGDQKRTVRPIGSSLWMRWPEFGVGLAPQEGTTLDDRKAMLKHWRGARADRPWPSTLEPGGPGNLPWIDRHSLARSA